MSSFRNKVYRARLEVLKLVNRIKYHIVHGTTVNVVSCDKYRNKIKEDLMLQRYLLNAGYKAKISSWEANDYADINVIRSVWGYHKRVDEFLDFVRGCNTINEGEIIADNIDKQKQFSLLWSNDIKTVDTLFLQDISQLQYGGERLVVKPTVSASGDNTFIVRSEQDIEKVKHLRCIMVQPFIEGINNGEISVICINGAMKYGIRRYPGVFSKYKKEEFIHLDDLDAEVLEVVERVIAIEEYRTVSIMRVDLVETGEGYRVMEVELVDPDLYVEAIPNTALKGEVYKDLVQSVGRYLNKENV